MEIFKAMYWPSLAAAAAAIVLAVAGLISIYRLIKKSEREMDEADKRRKEREPL